jgi:hypothetical protein
MSPEDAQRLAGTPHNRGGGRVGHRWGRTKRKILSPRTMISTASQLRRMRPMT